MNKNIFFKLIIIAVIALLLRSWNLDKPEGLWNDEYVAWFISSQNTFSSFCREILNNCHMPLYYIFLKIWTFLFTDADLSLRISSVFCSVISVFVMYLTGKELKDEKLGLLTALFCAVSSFLIYFAQEVRIYSLLFLFSSYSLWAWIKCAKDFSKRNKLNLLLANTLIIFTHTIGIVFVILNVLSLLIYLKKGRKETVKTFMPYLFLTVLILPFLYKLGTSNTLSQFWSGFNLSKIYFVLSDFFSPLQINVINTPKNVWAELYKNNSVSFPFVLFSVFPLLLSLWLIFKSLSDKMLRHYALGCGAFILVLIFASMLGKIIFITKYSMEIYPFILLAVSFALLQLDKKVMISALSFLLILNSAYLVFSHNSAPKLTRPEGNFAPVAMIENARLEKDDLVVLTYYDTHFFTKYFNPSDYNIIEITKYTYPYFLFSSEPEVKNIIRDKQLKYYDFFRFNDDTYFAQAFKNEIYDKMPRHSKVAFVFLDTVSFYTDENLVNMTPTEYKNTPFIFLAFSYLKNNVAKQAKANRMKLAMYLEAGAWTLIEFEKE